MTLDQSLNLCSLVKRTAYKRWVPSQTRMPPTGPQSSSENIQYELQYWFSLQSSDHTIYQELDRNARCILVLPLLQMGGGAGLLGHRTGVVPPHPTSSWSRKSRMILRITLKQFCLPKAPRENNTHPTFRIEIKLCLRFRGHNDCENTLKIKRDHTNVNIVQVAQSLMELYEGEKQNKWKRHTCQII